MLQTAKKNLDSAAANKNLDSAFHWWGPCATKNKQITSWWTCGKSDPAPISGRSLTRRTRRRRTRRRGQRRRGQRQRRYCHRRPLCTWHRGRRYTLEGGHWVQSIANTPRPDGGYDFSCAFHGDYDSAKQEMIQILNYFLQPSKHFYARGLCATRDCVIVGVFDFPTPTGF